MIWRLVDSAAMNGYFSDDSQRVENKGYKLVMADPIMPDCSGSDLLRREDLDPNPNEQNMSAKVFNFRLKNFFKRKSINSFHKNVPVLILKK
jgi:hypothetical protein